ncbi:helix-turn-helix transcriptional regulator [Hymenobacter sp. BT507]|uniref:Helix-turn-helix transcriptional regulator n=1 Tax=Hymenobacter citatus TaxID=2763506 RepID=A0ABR7MFZ1_9BACT|nr:helix-turn-helix transcriptional regulator [Hymenobacter citatus]MBC6609640.1 helix-turn-helix transcriptional regulator [Hymenobacter citatus]
MFSPVRIVALRKSKGYSQEVLAEESGVSLRTIQRVEQGETVPRGHTMQALAAALQVPLESLHEEPAPVEFSGATEVPTTTPLRADPQFLQLLNLSALSLLLFPLLNILVPLLLWRSRRHNTEHVAEIGRRVVGFQVLWQVGCFFLYLLLALAQVAAASYFRGVVPSVFIGALVLTYAANVLTVGYYARQLQLGNLNVYRYRI